MNTCVPSQNSLSFQHEVEACAGFLAERLAEKPEIVMQLGTGLGDLAGALEHPQLFPYAELPHFPETTVTSHRGRLAVGRIAGRVVAILQGRFHYYEGHSARRIGFPIRVLSRLGAKIALITNASGGLNPELEPGAILIAKDHINLLPENPLRGPNVDAWGPRFPDCAAIYDPALRKTFQESAAALQLPKITSGVYVCVPGPSLETPAETRYFRLIGGDAIGMSSVPEVLTAHHAGMRVAMLSVVSNVNNPDAQAPIRIEDIVAAAQAAEPRLRALILHALPKL